MVSTISKSIEAPVLVLNQNYQPLNICSARRAIVLMGRGKAESIVNGLGEIRSSSSIFPLPSVVRLFYMVKKPLVSRRISRQAIFYRDNFTCQYCGLGTKKLTIDHVIPRSKGGKHTWENVASACAGCNHRKAGFTLTEARMKLKTNLWHLGQTHIISSTIGNLTMSGDHSSHGKIRLIITLKETSYY